MPASPKRRKNAANAGASQNRPWGVSSRIGPARLSSAHDTRPMPVSASPLEIQTQKAPLSSIGSVPASPASTIADWLIASVPISDRRSRCTIASAAP